MVPVHTFSVGEVASRIRRVSDNMSEAQLVERIRGWTKEGLLVPVGEKSRGTGRHRRYSYAAVSEALLLKVLSDAIARMQAIKSRGIGDLFKATKEVFANGTHDGKLLVIGLTPEGSALEVKLSEREKLNGILEKSRCEAHMIIDLGKLF